ncbi:MAG: threonine synthase [Armatimonadota bacterium]|nr:threonine synthase [Armatimonadota bacterium]MDR7449393.1 threonine synthase [Armatimonadota bacterium]MDR7459805.1 threonine synthase [Armatimonadota bacterium]MDR7480265.1 threonine synthase [Armatimonadota bacterium]MDR7488700.1 threonine synthase [Armatimonadota bacterium]
MGWPGVIEAYRDFLPVSSRTPVITLLEGNTPLVPSTRLGPHLGLRLFFKVEGANPTGSFKDRGMTVAVSRALERGARGVLCASTGNTAASAAAYAARARLPCLVLLPAEGVAVGKLAQVAAHGARLVLVQAGFDAAMAAVRALAAELAVAVVNSLNPDRLAGQQTAAFELCEALEGAPDVVVLPVGNAGNITAYWQGFRAFQAAGRIATLPRMVGVQAEGAAPLVRGEAVPQPETVASAIRIGHPVSWDGARRAVAESGGQVLAVSDGAILQAQRALAEEEGLLVEPASAAAYAGVERLAVSGLARGSLVVCVLTGHGLKDPDVLRRGVALPEPVAPDLDTLRQVLTRHLA